MSTKTTADKIMALADEYMHRPLVDSRDGSTTRNALREAIEALVRDAERHRFMRFANIDEMAAKYWPEGEVPTGDEYDAAVDAAMQEKQS